MKKFSEQLINTVKNTSRDIAKTITESFVENNEALDNLNIKFLQILNDRGIVASYLLSLLSEITHPGNTSQYKPVKDSNANRVNDLLIHNTIPVTLYDTLLTFRDKGKIFDLKGDFLKMITNKNLNVDLAILSDKKLLYDFAKEMYFDVKTPGNKSTRDLTIIKLLKSTGIIVSASVVSKKFSQKQLFSSNPDELCDRLQ